MQISINGKLQKVLATNLAELLIEYEYSGRVATAVNETFVPVDKRPSTILSNGDRVEVLAPMQGG
ncbi:MAG: sulfur carrier protein ThiS [Rhodobacteraceae bacterium]|nr:sulfur carrier protein ThiS [Paracoccaceae bacterium]MCY4250006.1 sulfur carrier protein ThiS [Paracoccaceae bacterium]MCY4307655.1 sulfur carrier protein ThiS [Paracoccaceae bacterium]